MSKFAVFLDGSVDSSNDGIDILASAISNRFGLPATDLKTRMQHGKVRVKTNVDRAAAEQLASELRSLGAVVSIAAVGNEPDPRPSNSALSALSGVAATMPAKQYQSGLSAAYKVDAKAEESTGADAFSALSSLNESALSSGANVSGSDGELTLAQETRAPVSSADRFAPPPGDRFAPPGETELNVTVEAAGPRATRTQSLVEKELEKEAARQAEKAAKPKKSIREHFGNERLRLAVGVFVAILLGFIPATLVTSWREGSGYQAIDNRVKVMHAEADTIEAWEKLDPLRDNQLEKKRSEKKAATALGIAIWVVFGAGIAFVWFRKLPWDDWTMVDSGNSRRMV